MLCLTSFTIFCALERIHLSGRKEDFLSVAEGFVSPSKEIDSFDAFQILLTKFLEPSILSSERSISRPCAASMVRVNRNASVPYWSMMVRGSMTLPLDLLIFFPSASRTSAWMYTSLKGTSPMNLMPIMIMRATQKKRISKPVISSDVG